MKGFTGNKEILRRLKRLENQQEAHKLIAHSVELRVPVVDENGERVKVTNWFGLQSFTSGKTKKISFEEVCRALQDMCGIEITYQEIKGSSKVVIYEQDK